MSRNRKDILMDILIFVIVIGGLVLLLCGIGKEDRSKNLAMGLVFINLGNILNISRRRPKQQEGQPDPMTSKRTTIIVSLTAIVTVFLIAVICWIKFSGR